MHRLKVLLALQALLVSSLQAQVSSQRITSQGMENKRQVKFEGWDQFVGGSIYGTFNDSQEVVGKEDGTTTTLGIKVNAELDFKKGDNEWRNGLSLNTSYSKTPLLDDYVKSEDIFKIDSIYLFYIPGVDWAGPFAKANISTALSPGYAQKSEATVFQIIDQDGKTSEVTTDKLKLTDPFRPVRLKESLGFFVQPYKSNWASLELRLGYGFRQLLARDQLVVRDDPSTSSIEIQEIRNHNQSGYEAGLEFAGKTPNKRVSYRLTADMLLPLYESNKVASNEGKSLFEKRVIEMDAIVSFHLLDWVSLDYQLKSIRDPAVVDKTQLSQSILLSMNQIIAPRRAN